MTTPTQLDEQIIDLRAQLRLLKKVRYQSHQALHSGESEAMKWIYKYKKEHNKLPRMLDICEILNISQATLSTLVDRLIKKGLVIREVAEYDKRVKLLAISEKGEAVLLSHLDEQHKQISHLVTQLGSEDAEQLIRILKRVNVIINNNPIIDTTTSNSNNTYV